MQEVSESKKVIVGLTGNIASGKSSVAKYLEGKGYPVIYTDALTNDMYESDDSFKEAVVLLMGDSILVDGKIDKSKVGSIVFNNKDKLKELEAIIHPIVLERSLEIMSKLDGLIIFEVPLLFEASYDKVCDKVIFVEIDKKIQLERLMSRNHLTKEEALTRISSQVAQEEKMFKADFIIRNNDDLEHLYKQVDGIIQKIEGDYFEEN